MTVIPGRPGTGTVGVLAVRKNSGAVVGTRSQINLIEGSNVTLTVSDDSGTGEVDVTIASSGGGGGVSDGDKGDIVVSGSGTVYTIDAASVTVAKMAASATDVLFGRSTAGAGAGEEIACTSAGRALLDDANASAQRTTLGLGTAAVVDTGTGAANVPTTAQADVRYAAASHGVHLTDGDKGDITVASSGAAWTLDASAHLGRIYALQMSAGV